MQRDGAHLRDAPDARGSTSGLMACNADDVRALVVEGYHVASTVQPVQVIKAVPLSGRGGADLHGSHHWLSHELQSLETRRRAYLFGQVHSTAGAHDWAEPVGHGLSSYVVLDDLNRDPVALLDVLLEHVFPIVGCPTFVAHKRPGFN